MQKTEFNSKALEIFNSLVTTGCDVSEITERIFFGYLYSIPSTSGGVLPDDWEHVLIVCEDLLKVGRLATELQRNRREDERIDGKIEV